MIPDPHRPPNGTILMILHQEHSCPARIGRLLHTMGYALDMRRPRYGDPLPATLDGHAGVVVFGGPMSANDEEDYIRTELAFIERVLKAETPLLGVCLGAQMLARTLGERVRTHDAGAWEVGYYPIEPTAEGRAYCAAAFPEHVYQWHQEGFDLPRGATLLAKGEVFPNQAFSYGRAVGLQFHPEVTYATICRWTTRGAEKTQARGAQPRRAHMDGWYRHDAAIARWIDSFLHCWVGHGEGVLTPPAAPWSPLILSDA